MLCICLSDYQVKDEHTDFHNNINTLQQSNVRGPLWYSFVFDNILMVSDKLVSYEKSQYD